MRYLDYTNYWLIQKLEKDGIKLIEDNSNGCKVEAYRGSEKIGIFVHTAKAIESLGDEQTFKDLNKWMTNLTMA